MGATIKAIGNLAADPISKEVSGKTVVEFRLFADNYRWNDVTKSYEANGGEWFNVSVWTEGLGQAVLDVFKKGMRVQVEGQLKVSRYISKRTEEKEIELQIIADDVTNRLNRVQEIVLKPRNSHGEELPRPEQQA
jgi:single-strand DNA-binding protein